MLSDIRAMPSSQMDTSAGPRASAQGSSEKENVDFIKLDMWPTNSLDLNPVDYAVCGALQQQVYHRRKFHTVEELKRAIITEWQCFVDSSINEWRRCLECVVKNSGRHIEHCNLS